MADHIKVFVSHTNSDDGFTRTLVDDLGSAGAEVWVDFGNIDHNDYVAEINDALASCQWMVIVITPAALRSEWVQLEGNIGIARSLQHRLRGVLPLLAAPTSDSMIPATWSTLERYDATRDYHLALGGILAAMGLASGLASQPNVIAVNPVAESGPRTIVEALALAADHDRIKLWPGIYTESVTIDKPVEIVGHGEVGEVVLAPQGGVIVSASKVRMDNVVVWVGAPKDPQQVYAQAKADAVKEKAGAAGGVAIGAGVVAVALAAHITLPIILIAALFKGLDTLFRNNSPSRPVDIQALQVLGDAALELRGVSLRSSIGPGIVVRGRVEAYQCRISNCKSAGCAVEGELVLEDSQVVENAVGIFVTKSGKVSAHRNQLLRNAVAVRVEGAGSGTIDDNVLGGNKETWSIAKECVTLVKHDHNIEDFRA